MCGNYFQNIEKLYEKLSAHPDEVLYLNLQYEITTVSASLNIINNPHVHHYF